MKLTLLLSILAATMVAAPALGDDAHHSEAKSAQSTKAGCPVNEQASAAMSDNMKKMQEQMAKIHATTDPKERATLLREHMRAMQDTMPMMRGGMGGGTKPKQDGAGRGMDMMQMMMDQMVEHQNAKQDMGK